MPIQDKKTKVDQILVLNGPNLNLLGKRETDIYGQFSLPELETHLTAYAESLGASLRFVQSNHEGKMIDAIHDALSWAGGIIINPGAYGHTSIGIRDAIAGVGLPTVEVHISNVAARETFRHHSMISAVCIGTITGLGWRGYQLALDYLNSGK
jgi:3-dehydroquinate dehydratase-2